MCSHQKLPSGTEAFSGRTEIESGVSSDREASVR